MERATITIHLPTHRRASLKPVGNTQQASEAYDSHIGRYVEFLKTQARESGFRVETDHHDLDPVFSIEERDREQKKAAHAWLHRQPDVWEWIT